MLTTINTRPRNDDPDLVDLLLECHQRIRHFAALAREAGTQLEPPPEDQLVDACLRLERYFEQALPLHVADEEQSILPRLRGQSADIERALATMQDQHTEHEAKLGALLQASSRLRAMPSDETLRARLGEAAMELELAFAEHLALEEQTILPAIRRLLPTAMQADVIAELRARRVSATPAVTA